MDKCTRCGKESYHNNLCESCLVALDKWNTIHEIELIEDQQCDETYYSITLSGKPIKYLEYSDFYKKDVEYEVGGEFCPNELMALLNSFGVMCNITHKQTKWGKVVAEAKYTNRGE